MLLSNVICLFKTPSWYFLFAKDRTYYYAIHPARYIYGLRRKQCFGFLIGALLLSLYSPRLANKLPIQRTKYNNNVPPQFQPSGRAAPPPLSICIDAPSLPAPLRKTSLSRSVITATTEASIVQLRLVAKTFTNGKMSWQQGWN